MKKLITGIFITAAILTISVTSVWAHGHGGRFNSGNGQYCANGTCYNGCNYVDADGDGVCDNYNLRGSYNNNTYYGQCHGGGYCRY